MVLITLYKKLVKDSKPTGKVSTQRQPCQHQGNTSFNSDIGLTTAFGNELSPPEVLDAQKHSERYASDDAASCSICKDEKKAMRIYRMKLMGGLFFPFLVQTLDSTIIAGALTFIASDFSLHILQIIPEILLTFFQINLAS